MLIKIIVAIPIILTLIVRFLIVGTKAYKINNIIYLACMIVLPVGMFLTVTQSLVLQEHIESSSNPTVKGIVIKSEIAGNEQAYRPEITYEYTIDSITYTITTSLNSPMFGNKRKQYDVARVTTNEYRVGRELDVLYDPTNPSEGSLPIALAWNVYGQIGFGAFLIMLSLFGLLMPRKKSWL